MILNAKDAEPKPVLVPLGVKPGTQAITPEVVRTAWGKDYAAGVPRPHKDSDAQDVLEVISLDPNDDRDFSDAKVLKTLKVGKTR